MFTPILAKHTKSFNLVDTLSVGVDGIQRNFEPMQCQVESWRETQITDERAKLIFYSAFVEGKLSAPKNLLSEVHRMYFKPQCFFAMQKGGFEFRIRGRGSLFSPEASGLDAVPAQFHIAPSS